MNRSEHLNRKKPKLEREEPFSRDELLDKLQHYCAYQDRCIFEVREKLSKLEADEEDSLFVIHSLKTGRFWDERRFAMNFVYSKWTMKKWGRLKIRKHLRAKKVAYHLWEEAFNQIDLDEYLETMAELGQRKWDLLTSGNEFARKKKVHDFLIGRGFEKSFVMEFIFKLSLGE